MDSVLLRDEGHKNDVLGYHQRALDGAFILHVMGLVGAALAIAKPRLAEAMMLISAIGGIISVSAGYAIGAVLLIIAANFAFFDRKDQQT